MYEVEERRKRNEQAKEEWRRTRIRTQNAQEQGGKEKKRKMQR